MKQFSLLFILFVIFFTACSSPAKQSDYITLHLEKEIKSMSSERTLNDISSDYRVIPLETNDFCLLSAPRIKHVSDSDIWIEDNHVIYRFDKKGRLLFKLDKKGQGPEEYLSISDFVIDYRTQTIFIYDMNKKKIITYSFEGKYLDAFKNDFIGSFDLINENDFIVSYTPYSDKPFYIGIYDKSWNELNQFLPKTEVLNQKKGIFHFDILYKFNEKYHFIKAFGDTIYQVNSQSVQPYIVVSKGNLKMPVHIATDISKKKERSLYIFGEYGYIISDYYFSLYYYQNNRYHDIWDLKTSSLVCRNLNTVNNSKDGIPFVIQEKTIFVWPNFVCNEYMYCVVSTDKMQDIIPELKEEDNPVILELRIKGAKEVKN
jgi:hypothetical protein